MEIICRKVRISLVPSLLLLLILDKSHFAWTQDTISSMTHMRHLVDSEDYIVSHMREYLRREHQRLDDIEELLENGQGPKALSKHDLYHPVGAYQLIKRWFIVTEKVADRRNEELLQSGLVADQLPMVTSRDSYGAALALLRLQRVYNLSTDDLAQGNVNGKQVLPLTELDFALLGQLAMVIGEYGLSIQWLERSLPASLEKDHANTLSEIAKANFYVGDFEASLRAIDKAVLLDPMNQTLHHLRTGYFMKNASFYEENGGMPAKPASTWQREMPLWRTMYERLCRGEETPMVQRRHSKLHCRYRKTRIPIVVIKEEVLNTDPWIAMFYDVITDADGDELKRLATPKLQRALVGDPANSVFTNERVSKVGWLWDNEEGPMNKLSRWIDVMTGLDTTYRQLFSSAEPFQVVNYGLGGQYEPHVDYYEDGMMLLNVPHYIKDTGDRLVTFMFYLTDVEGGGSTVFPKLGVRVPAVKNAAAFWFNMQKNGDVDPRTQHAGCPVLMGEKWVANKWIRSAEQMFRRKCGLTRSTEADGY